MVALDNVTVARIASTVYCLSLKRVFQGADNDI